MNWIDWEGFFDCGPSAKAYTAINNAFIEEEYDYIRDRDLWQLMQVEL